MWAVEEALWEDSIDKIDPLADQLGEAWVNTDGFNMLTLAASLYADNAMNHLIYQKYFNRLAEDLNGKTINYYRSSWNDQGPTRKKQKVQEN